MHSLNPTLIPPRTTCPEGKTRPRIVLTTESGCSKISFCMNVLNSPLNIKRYVYVCKMKVYRNLENAKKVMKNLIISCNSMVSS